MPSLDQLQSQKNLNNLKIFPINVGQDNLEKASKFFEDLGIDNLKIYFDSPITLAKKFGLRGVPTTILINKDGYEFARIVGSIDFKEKNFVEWLANHSTKFFSLKSIDPTILANSYPSLFIKIVVGTPLSPNFFAKVIGESKYILRLSIPKSSKNLEAFSKLS